MFFINTITQYESAQEAYSDIPIFVKLLLGKYGAILWQTIFFLAVAYLLIYKGFIMPASLDALWFVLLILFISSLYFCSMWTLLCFDYFKGKLEKVKVPQECNKYFMRMFFFRPWSLIFSSVLFTFLIFMLSEVNNILMNIPRY